MKRYISILVLLVFSLFLFAQNIETEQAFKKGEELFNMQKYNEALPFLTVSANEGNDEAQFLIGKIYDLGLGTEADFSKAIQWYEKSSEQGNAKALNNLGNLYARGNGVERDYLKAKSLYEKSAMQGFGMAFFNLGSLYYYGHGVTKDYTKAFDYYKKAEEKDAAAAMVMLAAMYRNGSGVKQDYSAAIKLYHRAAELNEPLAQDQLGSMYAEGIGVKKNYSKAISWYRKAADQKYGWALQHLGYLYMNGLGVKKDYAEGAWLIRQAAEQGLEISQLNMGVIYENGFGVTKDLDQAAEWYNKVLATNPDNEEAKRNLARIKPEKEASTKKSVESSENQNQQNEEDVSIDASGTGFIIDKRGYLATNNHVTKGARGIYVCLLKDGIWKSYNAVSVKNDQTNDLSIIQIDDAEFKPFDNLPYNFTTEVEDVAAEIYTLGYPQVHIMGTEVKYTTGAINSKSGIQGDPTHYQISAHIDHGNSGGPMFNSKGAIIGITDSGLDKAEYGDVNYAIKSSYLKSLVDALPVKLELPHDTSIEKLSRVEQIKVLSKYTALILIDLP